MADKVSTYSPLIQKDFEVWIKETELWNLQQFQHQREMLIMTGNAGLKRFDRSMRRALIDINKLTIEQLEKEVEEDNSDEY